MRLVESQAEEEAERERALKDAGHRSFVAASRAVVGGVDSDDVEGEDEAGKDRVKIGKDGEESGEDEDAQDQKVIGVSLTCCTSRNDILTCASPQIRLLRSVCTTWTSRASWNLRTSPIRNSSIVTRRHASRTPGRDLGKSRAWPTSRLKGGRLCSRGTHIKTPFFLDTHSPLPRTT